jgi:hypothetical protein
MNPRLFEVMHRHAGVFSGEQAAAAGLSRDELRSLLRRGEVIRVRRDIYTTAVLWNSGLIVRHRIESAAALLARAWVPGGPDRLVVGHRSAACLWGLRLPWAVAGKPGGDAKLSVAGVSGHIGPSGVELVSADRCKRTYRAGVSVRPAQLPPAHVVHRDGVPVTSLARTAVDLMRESDRINALIVADQAVRLGCVKDELVEVAEYCAGWRGGKQALDLAHFADGRAESGAESLGRLVARDFGLPPCVPQLEIRDARGRKRRLDIAFRAQWTALEPDGKIKYDDPHGNLADVLWDEKLREDSVRDVGWEVVRTTWNELFREPERVVGRLVAAFARAERRHAC